MDNPTDTGALLPVTPFEREERYIVFKKSHLTQKQIDTLDKLRTPPGIPPVNWHDDHTMPTVECVVVEADWPEYEPVWSMIKARVNGRHQSETGAALTRDGRKAGSFNEKAVMVCPQCDGEGGYPDGLDEAACHTDCTRCAGNGWIVDIAALAQPVEAGEDGLREADWLNLMPREIVARAALTEGCREETADAIRSGLHTDVKIRADVAVKLIGMIQQECFAALSPVE